MPTEIPLQHKIALGIIPHIGDINARKLVSYFGDVEAVFREPYQSLVKIPGIGQDEQVFNCERSYLSIAEKEAEYVIKNNIRTFFYLDNDYPYRLRQCDDSPVVFYFTGNCDLNSSKYLECSWHTQCNCTGKELCENSQRACRRPSGSYYRQRNCLRY